MSQAKRVLFTGGSGKAGRHVVPYLVDRGTTRVVNVDLMPLDHPGVDNLSGRHRRFRADVRRHDHARQPGRAGARRRAEAVRRVVHFSPPCRESC